MRLAARITGLASLPSEALSSVSPLTAHLCRPPRKTAGSSFYLVVFRGIPISPPPPGVPRPHLGRQHCGTVCSQQLNSWGLEGPLQSTDKFLGASLWHSTHQEPITLRVPLGLQHYVASTLCQNHWRLLATITLRQCAPRKCIFSYETHDLKLLSCPVPHPSPISRGDEINLRTCAKS